MRATPGGRQIVGAGAADKDQSIAQSLPVNIPLPEVRARVLDVLASDQEDDDDDDLEGSEKEYKEEQRRASIPKKMAEIARSLYDQIDEFPSSPPTTTGAQLQFTQKN